MIRPEAVARLRAAGVADPAGDARRLFDWAYGLGAGAGAQTHEAPNVVTRQVFARALDQRAARQPMAQITGTRAFWRHDFLVTPDVLDPRPETETLVAAALSAPFARVLDLGTGTGCVLVSLLAERPSAAGLGTDLSAAALAVAEVNAARAGVDGRAALRCADWFDGVPGRYDLIVSNPPYVDAATYATLQPEIRLHEPQIALTPGGDGLGAYRTIAVGAPQHLVPGGRLMVEVGYDQAEAVAGLLAAAGLDGIGVHADLAGRDRVVVARAAAQPTP